MSIDKDKIKHISKLARISIDSKKSDSLAKDLTFMYQKRHFKIRRNAKKSWLDETL